MDLFLSKGHAVYVVYDTRGMKRRKVWLETFGPAGWGHLHCNRLSMTDGLVAVTGGPPLAPVRSDAGDDHAKADDEANDPRNKVQNETSSWFGVFERREACLAIKVCHDAKDDNLEDGMKKDEPGDRPPNPSSPGVGANADEQGNERQGSQANAQFAEVLSRTPCGAEPTVLVITIVLDRQGEATAGIVLIIDGATIGTGERNELAFAALHQAVANSVLRVAELILGNEPVWEASRQDVQDESCEGSNKRDSVRCLPHGCSRLETRLLGGAGGGEEVRSAA